MDLYGRKTMTATKTTRRKFFKILGLTLGGSALACCGLGYAVSRDLPKAPTAVVEMPGYTFGKGSDAATKPILVTYATRTGSTVGVSTAIGETIAARGNVVDVKPVNENPDPGAYRAVIIGSAVNGGKWLPEAVEYVQRYQQALQQAPAAFFCVHILNLGSDPVSQKNRLAYLDDVRTLVKPVNEAFFAGKGVDPKETSPILLWALRTTHFVPEGDCRDWNKIRAWARTVFA